MRRSYGWGLKVIFADKIAVVTGGASGIGRATVGKLLQAGARVVVADIDREAAQRVAQKSPGQATAMALDVSREDEWKRVLGETFDKFKRLDILVNSAGIGMSGNFESLSLEDWNRMVAVNLTGTFLGCKHVVPIMRAAGHGGAIVNISSIIGLVGGADVAGYSATKGGVAVLTKSVALHCAQHAPGVRCNSVHPAAVNTEMLDGAAARLGSREAMLQKMAALIPLGRVAEADDIADVILFLASDTARMVTGVQLNVDGGQLAGLTARYTQ